MELRQLRHFLLLAEEMHYGRAAQRLHITQPALSISIAKLEQEFGVRLFDRGRTGIRLTVPGELMLQRAREVMNNAERAQGFASSLSQGQIGRVEMGFSTPVLRRDLEELLEVCRAELPQVDLVLREATSQKQLEMLSAGRLDAGLVSFPLPPPGLEHIELFEDRFMVCLPARHPLARTRRINLAQLRHEPFVFPSREGTPSIHDQLVGLCATAGFYPRVAYESQHSLSTISLVSRGRGIGFVLAAMAALRSPGVAFVDLDHDLPRRCAFFVWNAKREAPGLQPLIDRFQDYADSMPG